MKKILSISLSGVLIFLICASGVFARSHHRNYSSKNYLTFSWFLKPASLGLKHRLFRNVYATGNLDYRNSSNDLEFQAGAVYLIPRKIIIFRLYGGGGYQFSRNEGYQYPYVTVGTNFIFLFSEIIYPMRNGIDSKYRFGFSFKF